MLDTVYEILQKHQAKEAYTVECQPFANSFNQSNIYWSWLSGVALQKAEVTFPRRGKILSSQLEATEDSCKWDMFTLNECQQRIGNELNIFYMLGNKFLNGLEHQKGHLGLPKAQWEYLDQADLAQSAPYSCFKEKLPHYWYRCNTQILKCIQTSFPILPVFLTQIANIHFCFYF